MDKTLEEVLDDELYAKAREAILSYEELLEEAEAEVKRRTTPRRKDDLGNMPDTATCPDCDNETVVIGTELGDYCFFCRADLVMELCPSCGQYAPPDYFDGLAVCRDCFEQRVRSDRY